MTDSLFLHPGTWLMRRFRLPGKLLLLGMVMVAVFGIERLVGRQRHKNGPQFAIERGPVLPFRLALVVALELAGALNLPHADRPSDR